MTIATRELTQRYLLKTALDHVSVSFAQGNIHALVGENGAGKSTLASLLCGDRQPTEGSILIDGTPVRFASAKDARARGIVLVHQRPLLAQELNVAENIILDSGGRFFIHPPTQDLLRLRDAWAPQLDLRSPVKNLNGTMRFFAALLSALLLRPRCLLLDEPSAFLDDAERRRLYGKLQELARQGVCIIVITHSHAEARTYAQTVTVLRKGRLVQRYDHAADYHGDLSVGTVGSREGIPSNMDAAPCLRLESLCARPKNRPAVLNATIEVFYGRISAVTGQKEAALDTLENIVTGMERSRVTGSATFHSPDGLSVVRRQLARSPLTAAFLRRHKTAIVPSDRSYRAADPSLTVEQMLCVYERTNLRQHAADLIERAQVAISPDQLVSNLSGGMLQRLIVARELATQPRLLILCNPMQGLDIAAQGRLCQTLVAQARNGTAVLIIGAMDVPLSLCGRVYRMEGGVSSLAFGGVA